MSNIYWNAATMINLHAKFRFACYAISNEVSGNYLDDSKEADLFCSIFSEFPSQPKNHAIFGWPTDKTQNERIIALLLMHWMVNDKSVTNNRSR